MHYKTVKTELVKKQVKKLAKKYRTFNKDVENLETELIKNPTKGIHILEVVYKIQFKSKSKSGGKRDGFRCIYLVSEIEKLIVLLYVHDKSEIGRIPDFVIIRILKYIDLKEFLAPNND